MRSLAWTFLALALSLPCASAQEQELPKPYRTVSITIASAPADASLDQFRQRVLALAEAKDARNLAQLVGKEFFWDNFIGQRRPRSPVQQLRSALGLENADGSGWARLAAFARERVGPYHKRRGVVCAPPEPRYQQAEFEKLIAELDSNPYEWAHPREAGSVAVRKTADPGAETIETLGLHFVRVLTAEGSEEEQGRPKQWTRVATPSGKTGYVAAGDLLLTHIDRLCFAKAGKEGWKIAGFAAGGD